MEASEVEKERLGMVMNGITFVKMETRGQRLFDRGSWDWGSAWQAVIEC
jgi:hypothetical protein